jgi:acyl-CoA reductase-like NAD-dependent aldehyde dehydrogenase
LINNIIIIIIKYSEIFIQKSKMLKLSKINSKLILLSTVRYQHSDKFQKFPTETFINGEWVGASSKKTFRVTDPATNRLIGQVPDCDIDDVEIAVEAAGNGLKTWSNYTADQRSKVLKKLVHLHNEHKNDLAKIITQENGKPLREALGETQASINAYEYYAEEAKRINGDILQSPIANKRFLVVKQPIGICGILTPWNFPSSMIARKVAAALAAGCSVVIKPSDETPYSALALCQLAQMAGIPNGCINVLTTSKQNTPIVGKAICEHKNIKKISFTGSTSVGKLILSLCASTVKKTSLELGGNAPFIVFESGDVKKAVADLIFAKFRSTGQTCICANRIMVQESIYDEFIKTLADSMQKQLIMGNGFDDTTTQGPLINDDAIQRLSDLVNDCKNKGGTILIGGEKNTKLDGHFFEPTLIKDITMDMRIANEEIFGPIAQVIK